MKKGNLINFNNVKACKEEKEELKKEKMISELSAKIIGSIQTDDICLHNNRTNSSWPIESLLIGLFTGLSIIAVEACNGWSLMSLLLSITVLFFAGEKFCHK